MTKYCGCGIPHNWDMNFGKFRGLPTLVAYQKINLQGRNKSIVLSMSANAGLDTYFFTNLGVGQPSNNMDLSETKIYLGSIIYVFFAMKKSWRTLIINIFILISRFTVFKEPCHVINYWCSSLEVALFISVHFDVTGIRNIFQRI